MKSPRQPVRVQLVLNTVIRTANGDLRSNAVYIRPAPAPSVQSGYEVLPLR